MVSVSGYTIFQFVMIVLLTYIVFVVALASCWMRFRFDQKHGVVSVFVRFFWWFVAGSVVVMGLLLYLPVRVGTVMFVDGVLCSLLLWNVVVLVRHAGKE